MISIWLNRIMLLGNMYKYVYEQKSHEQLFPLWIFVGIWQSLFSLFIIVCVWLLLFSLFIIACVWLLLFSLFIVVTIMSVSLHLCLQEGAFRLFLTKICLFLLIPLLAIHNYLLIIVSYFLTVLFLRWLVLFELPGMVTFLNHLASLLRLRGCSQVVLLQGFSLKLVFLHLNLWKWHFIVDLSINLLYASLMGGFFVAYCGGIVLFDWYLMCLSCVLILLSAGIFLESGLFML